MAGWFWYRAGVHGGALADPSAADPTATTAPVTGGPAPASDAAAAVPSASAPAAPDPATTAAPGLVVHVAGGVVHPGVYQLPAGSRVDDAITAAGGPAPGVDIDAVNRAAPLTDGQRVRVPLPGEPPPPEPDPAAAPTPSGEATPAGPVNLNTATVEQLETLPGVGPAIAAAIVEQRTRTGGFRTVPRPPRRARHRREPPGPARAVGDGVRAPTTSTHGAAAFAPSMPGAPAGGPGPGRRLAPLVPVAAIVAGILAGERAPAGGGTRPLALAALAGTVAVVARRRPVRTVAALVALAALAGALELRARHGLEVSPLAPLVADRERVVLTGRLVGDPTRFGRIAVADVRVDGVAGPLDAPAAGEAIGADGPGPAGWRSAGTRHVLVRASGDEAGRLGVLESGDRVVVRGRLGPLSGFDLRWRTQHVVGALSVDRLVDARGPRDVPLRLANAVRRLVLAGGSSLPGTERALLAGFLVGDTRDVPDAVTDDFRAAGLSHLLAVSGANLVFVLAAVAPLLRRRSLPARALVGAFVVVLFGTMTRWEPSVLRAAAMAMVTLSATALGRAVDGVRVLALAAGGLLLADPFLLRSVGFLLSCGASAGILLFAEAIARRLPGPTLLRETAGVTLAAQLGTAPILLPVFGSVPLIAVPANLIAVPLAAPITVVGLGAGIAGGLLRPVWPGAATTLQLPVLGLVRAVELVAQQAARTPLAIDGRGVWGLVALAAAARALRQLRPGRRPVALVESATDQPDRAAVAPPRWTRGG